MPMDTCWQCSSCPAWAEASAECRYSALSIRPLCAGRGQSSPRDCALPSPTQERPIQRPQDAREDLPAADPHQAQTKQGRRPESQTRFFQQLTGCSSAKFREGNVLSIPNCSAVRARHKAERAGAKPSGSAELAASETSTQASPSSSSGDTSTRQGLSLHPAGTHSLICHCS